MLLGFQKQFVIDVLTGQKRQTIRSYRKRPFKYGDTLHIYTGLRTKSCQKLGEAVCIEVEDIIIKRNGKCGPEIWVGGIWYNRSQRDWLAHQDGFKSAEELFIFFENNHGLPFKGQLIKWDRLVGRVALDIKHSQLIEMGVVSR